MKLNKVRKNHGLTLIEVTLVIAVLLGLISVLFIGVAAYKKGSDRAKCILNIATVQKAVRSYQNLYEKENGDTLAKGDITGSGKMIETEPACPSTGTYTWAAAVPAPSTTYVSCSVADHVPSSIAGW